MVGLKMKQNDENATAKKNIASHAIFCAISVALVSATFVVLEPSMRIAGVK